MKTIVFSIFIFLFVSASFSQDTIVLKDDYSMKVKVIEITTTMVKYKRFDQKDGPVRNVPIADVKEILYEDGTKDVFTLEKSKNQNDNKRDVNESNNIFNSGIFLDLQIGYAANQRDGHYYNSNGQLESLSPEYLMLTLQFGNKWFFGKNEKWRPGIQATWIRYGISIKPDEFSTFIGGAKNLRITNIGMCNVFKFSENMGLELNFTAGLNVEVDFNYGYFGGGIAFTPEFKYRYKKMVVGLNYNRIQSVEPNQSSDWDIFSVSVGAKF